MTEYFVPPPYYYKQFTTPDEFPIPNLNLVKKHTDDYFSFGNFYDFKEIDFNQLEKLKNQLQQHNLTGNLKLKLKELSNQILDLCVKIQDSIAKVNQDHFELAKELKEKTKHFNQICQYINLKQKYYQLGKIYSSEIQQLIQLNKDMDQKFTYFEKQMQELKMQSEELEL